jgi:hypothetical protein
MNEQIQVRADVSPGPDIDFHPVIVNQKVVESKRLELVNNWNGNLSPNMSYQLARLSVAYGLDPFLGELVILGDKPYPTVAALQRKANENSDFDGEICRPATAEERKDFYFPMEAPNDEYLWRCEVSMRNRKHPFVGWGRASRNNVKMSTMQIWLPEMAQKRARGRAYRLAFNIGMPTIEEMYEFEDGTKMKVDKANEVVALASPEVIERIEKEVLTEENLANGWILQKEWDGTKLALSQPVSKVLGDKLIAHFLGGDNIPGCIKLRKNSTN